ncbi:MAG: hypothetical protein OXE99_11580, partial [Cellvibrionales bacterium]|nr:hypothetical protein [Cellvibrionales bacterium]
MHPCFVFSLLFFLSINIAAVPNSPKNTGTRKRTTPKSTQPSKTITFEDICRQVCDTQSKHINQIIIRSRKENDEKSPEQQADDLRQHVTSIAHFFNEKGLSRNFIETSGQVNFEKLNTFFEQKKHEPALKEVGTQLSGNLNLLVVSEIIRNCLKHEI